MLSERNKASILILTILVVILLADIFNQRWLAILDLWLIVLLSFFFSWQIGIKGNYFFLAINFGGFWAKFISIVLLAMGVLLAIWTIYVTIVGIPLKY